jgi:hypothetical protein
MKLLFIVAAIAVAILIARSIWSSRPSDANGNSAKSSGAKENNARLQARKPYRAISVVCDEAACSAAKKIQGRRFLDVERDVPKLPLSDCDAPNCDCRYEHHDDRRSSDDDRRHPNALQADLYAHSGNKEKRTSRRGRRKTDIA